MNPHEKSICVYGYNRDEAQTIQHALKIGIGEAINCVSASGKEDTILSDILTSSEDQTFTEDKTRIVLFYGFEDSMIPSLLQLFPPSVPRPIFCCLTSSNQSWRFQTLKKHLLEEQKAMHAQNQS